MKLIIAYIPMRFLGRISTELEKQGICDMSVSTAHSFDQEHDAQHPGQRGYVSIEHTKRLRIEIACKDSESDRILDTIYIIAHTGQPGNGHVLVLPILEELCLKTGERGCTSVEPPRLG